MTKISRTNSNNDLFQPFRLKPMEEVPTKLSERARKAFLGSLVVASVLGLYHVAGNALDDSPTSRHFKEVTAEAEESHADGGGEQTSKTEGHDKLTQQGAYSEDGELNTGETPRVPTTTTEMHVVEEASVREAPQRQQPGVDQDTNPGDYGS